MSDIFRPDPTGAIDELRIALSSLLLELRDEYTPSRRERIATAMAQGLLYATDPNPKSPENVAHWAVRHADALIAELNKDTNPTGAGG